MRVLMLTTSYPKYPGDGTAPFIERMAVAVAAAGHEVDVVLPKHRELRTGGRRGEPRLRLFPFVAGPARPHLWGYARSMAADRRVRIAALAVAPLASLSALAVMRARLRRERYDLVHAQWVLPNGPVAVVAARSARLPLVVGLHGSDVFMAEQSRVLGAAARWVFRSSAAVTACSRDLAERARVFGAAAETVPYGVDVEALAPAAAAAWRQRVGARDGDFVVVGLGRLVAKKGFRYLIEAASRLRRDSVPIRVAIGGGGDLSAELARTARERGVEDVVRLLGDVSHGEVGGLLQAADVIAVPSVREASGNVDGLPNVLLEALASGRPVVASTVGGIPDVIDDGRNGLLVPPADGECLADALRRLWEDRSAAERIGAAGRESARSLSWEEHGRSLVRIYQRSLERGAHRED